MDQTEEKIWFQDGDFHLPSTKNPKDLYLGAKAAFRSLEMMNIG